MTPPGRLLSRVKQTRNALLPRRVVSSIHRPNSTPVDSQSRNQSAATTDLAAIFTNPTWSVRSLLPQSQNPDSTGQSLKPSSAVPEQITENTLRHLLRLSALPYPKSFAETENMIHNLQSQLHFVRNIQHVETGGIEPLRSIRDETTAGVTESTLGQRELEHILSRETALGRSKRPRRQRDAASTTSEPDWDPLATASRKAGRFFVVESKR